MIIVHSITQGGQTRNIVFDPSSPSGFKMGAPGSESPVITDASEVLATGSVLSGTYDLPVMVDGDASLGADAVFNSDLIVSGTLTNPDGYALTVMGDLICLLFDWTPTDSSVSQANVTIHGNCKVFRKVVVTSVTGTVTADDFNGDLTTDADFSAAGIINDGTAVLTMTSGDDNSQTTTFNYGSPDNFTANNAYNLPSTGFYDHTGNTFSAASQQVLTPIWPVTPVRTPTFLVYGDLIAPYGFSIDGMSSDGIGPVHGGNIDVRGNVFSESGTISANAGQYFNDDPTQNGGNAGSITVGGNFVGSSSAGGADAWDDEVTAGNGGTINVRGDYLFPDGSGSIYVNGGSTWDGLNAGNAGRIVIGGSLGHPTPDDPYDSENTAIQAAGGDVNSSSRRATVAGDGGLVHVTGNIKVGAINLNGGSIDSSFDYSSNWPAGNPSPSGSGGVLRCDASVFSPTINISSGAVANNAGMAVRGGDAGAAVVKGDLFASVDGHGGHFSTAAGHYTRQWSGNGGSITVEGDFHGSFNLNGGSIDTRTTYCGAGNGGGITVKGNCYAYGGANGGANGGEPGFDRIDGGIGGSMDVRGSLYTNGNSLTFNGGDQSGNGYQNAGGGGSVTIKGDIECDTLNVDGGHGAGGTIVIYGDAKATAITAEGSDGDTTYAGNGGTVTIHGKAKVDTLSVNGGEVTAGSSSSYIGGAGGTLTIYGKTYAATAVTADGGASATSGAGGSGQMGGNGGTIDLKGGCYTPSVSANGGSAFGSHLVGSCGSINLRGEVQVGTLSMLDGVTGGAQSTTKSLLLSGYCSFDTVSVQNRSGIRIESLGYSQLKANTLTDKKTLWNGSVESPDISSFLNDAVFETDSSGNWLILIGESFGVASTTDATVTTAQTIATISDTTQYLRVVVTARRTGGSSGSAGDSAYYVLEGRIKNVGGTVTINDLTKTQSEDQAGWDADLDVSSTNVRVRVTGAANNNVSWQSTARKQRT